MRLLKAQLLLSRRVSSLALLVCAGAMGCAARAAPGDTGGPGLAPPATTSQPLPAPPPSGSRPATVAAARDCELSDQPGDPVHLVGLTGPVDPAHAPHPSNESERLVFRQLYETLVRLDCAGRARPALAASWHLEPDGRTWIVILRDGSSFSDGTPVTAADVIASWSRDGGGGELTNGARRLVQAASAVDDRSLAITLRTPRSDAPVALAHTDLAIARAVSGSAWPAGTRSVRVGVGDSPGPLANAARVSLVHLTPGLPVVEPPDQEPFVTFVVAASRDARDLLDAGVDLMLTRDPAALDYAATLPQYRRVPMAWRQTHVFVARGRDLGSPTIEQRQMLAADAVRGEARGAEEPFWWRTLSDCDTTPPRRPSPPQSSTRRIVYDADDGASRDLAERLVALAGTPPATTPSILDTMWPHRRAGAIQRAAGLTGDALAIAQRRGNDAGYVMTLERAPVDPCAEMQRAVEASEWLTTEAIVPLVDTRLQAILRNARAGAIVEGDGGVLLGSADRAR